MMSRCQLLPPELIADDEVIVSGKNYYIKMSTEEIKTFEYMS